ncbi:AraC family transcriptional regulator [Kitasatospora sp. NPDC001527]|uniref:AraC family transcriptional regulator n=1 Tax=Kitasatospora sp. NPDC001527 TaxID=3154519 RepID=UPI00332F2E2B
MSSRAYTEWRPALAPGRQVACLWTRRNAGGAEYGQLVVPDGCVDLVWSEAGLEVVGPDNAPRSVPVRSGAELAGLRLRPGAGGLLLGEVPVRELCDRQVPLAELAGAATAERLGERLARAPGLREAAAELDAFAASLAPGRPPDRVVERAVAALGRAQGARVPELAAELGLSERQLRRRVTDAVGYGPKTLHAVLRFQRALAFARADRDGAVAGDGGVAGERERERGACADRCAAGYGAGAGSGLAEVAVRAGYADQAHLTREVRRWAGVPPTVLLGRTARPGGAVGQDSGAAS